MLLAFLLLAPPRAEGLRLGPGGFQVSSSEVFLSRTVTVTVELEDDLQDGAVVMEALVSPSPAHIVRLLKAETPPSFGCTANRMTSGRWIYEALAPGIVEFKLYSSVLSCTRNTTSTLEVLSSPVTLKPVPVWSELIVSPQTLAPGGVVTLKLLLRNDSGDVVSYSAPRADVFWPGVAAPLAVPLGGPLVAPEAAMRANRLTLAPGKLVTVTWKFKTRASGRVKFQIIGAGLLITSPPAVIRPSPRLALEFDELKEPSAVGREFIFRGSLRHSGVVGVVDLAAAVSWSPPQAARLISGSLSSTEPIMPGARSTEVRFALELLQPGPLVLTVTAGGQEADTGDPVPVEPVMRTLHVQPPPEIDLMLVLDSATALVGSSVSFKLAVANRGAAGADRMAPLLVFHAGRVTQQPLAPLYQGVPAGGTAWFNGKIVLTGEGPVSFSAQVTTRSDRGGEWLTFRSDRNRVLAVPNPRIGMEALQPRVYTGGMTPLRFTLHNQLGVSVTIKSVLMTLGGETAEGLYRRALEDFDAAQGLPDLGAALFTPKPLPVSLSLAPGGSATLTVEVFLPPASQPYWVRGLVRLAGEVGPYAIPFTAQLGPRLLTRACPPQPGLILVEPAPVFLPPLDLLMLIEWTMTAPGQAGLAIVTPGGQPVRTLVPLGRQEPGWHSALWFGNDDTGRPVPAGNYVIRLAGTAGSQTPSGGGAPPAWPGNAVWKSDHPIQLNRP